QSFLVGRASALLHTQKPGSATPVHTYRFAPLGRETALGHLDDLVSLYRFGRTEPLLLFPKSALAQAASEGDAVSPAARKIFETNERRYDPHLMRLFADAGVLSPDSDP